MLARVGESLAGHHLEQVAPGEVVLGHADDAGVAALLVIPGRRGVEVRLVGVHRHGACQAHGRALVGEGEVVVADLRRLALMVDDQQLVGQVEHQVTLVLGAGKPQRNRLELEGEVVAERTVEAEVGVLGRAKQLDQRPHHREHRGLAAALLLVETAAGRGDGAGDTVSVGGEAVDAVHPLAGLRRWWAGAAGPVR